VNRSKFIVSLVALILVSACGEQKDAAGVFAYEKDLGGLSTQQEKNDSSKYLAYTHTIALALKNEEINPTHTKLVNACEQDTKFNCAILNSSVSIGDSSGRSRSSGSLTLRLLPEGVAYFESLLKSQGELISRSSKAEDLADSILDTKKRIDMLQSYRDNLLELEDRPDNTIDALVKITSELATVQNKLEYAQGQKAKMMQRVTSDLLIIHLHMPYGTSSFWEPVSYSLEEFGENLSEGIATVITFAAYCIPWSIFLFLLFLLLRFVWRMLRKPKHAG